MGVSLGHWRSLSPAFLWGCSHVPLNLRPRMYRLLLPCNLGNRRTYVESYEQTLYTFYPRLQGMKDDLQGTGMTSWPSLPAPGLMMGVSRGHKEKCGALASRQRWHFALAVTTGKPALALITASKPWATCLFSLLRDAPPSRKR